MLQTLKLNNKKWKKSLFYKEKSLVGLTLRVKQELDRETKAEGHKRQTQ
jgi:hypothetical protein